MIESVATAIASAVAQQSAGKVREIIEQSESPEDAWKKSCYEVAIKVRTSYKQNQEVEMADDEQFSRDLENFGNMARELAVYGDIKGFDEELQGKVEELAEGCANTARSKSGIGNTLESKYQDEDIPSILEYIIENSNDE
ncbi:hypothetical protein EXE44_03275 [Halorubrum sp. SS7]|uniref:hypothetical protein n=1 Tax=unclassified Halorubrum TaxID=2642239 RepID=UPI0010F91915|nr:MULTISPECIES: hypothetical protein [unclassified Halorubrum]TKX59472.1 hypothetical protein EXE44_03275 [Halorubrum sp. SS7]TKX63171.1 hypothetical protein EXE45_16875 [Halorubrum sp. SP9]